MGLGAKNFEVHFPQDNIYFQCSHNLEDNRGMGESSPLEIIKALYNIAQYQTVMSM